MLLPLSAQDSKGQVCDIFRFLRHAWSFSHAAIRRKKHTEYSRGTELLCAMMPCLLVSSL